MKLYAKIVNSNEYRCAWNDDKSQEEGWYELERELEEGEYPEYDEQNDWIVIKKREKSAEELEAERQAAVKRQLVADLPDIILQNKDNPEALAQALCDRVKGIEVTNDLRTA